MADAGTERIAAVRHFNRFYTRRIGVLHEGLLASPFSLAEVRVLYELAHRPGITARDLARDLGLDGGYLSRILQGFARRKLVSRGTSAADARQRPLTLTPEGRRTFAPLDRRSHEEVAALLAPLADSEQDRLAGAMQTIERLLEPGAADAPFVLRSHRPGDMGWVIRAHGELYWREYGWDERFEALVAHIAAEFIEKFDPQRERCWIAERDGERVGSVFLVRKSASDSEAAAADRRAEGARSWPRQASRRRVPALRADVRLPPGHAVDAAEPARRAAYLSRGGLCAGGARKPFAVRRPAGWGDLRTQIARVGFARPRNLRPIWLPHSARGLGSLDRRVDVLRLRVASRR